MATEMAAYPARACKRALRGWLLRGLGPLAEAVALVWLEQGGCSLSGAGPIPLLNDNPQDGTF